MAFLYFLMLQQENNNRMLSEVKYIQDIFIWYTFSHLDKHSLSPMPEFCQMAQILRSSQWGIQRKIWNGYANLDIKSITERSLPMHLN